MTHSETVAAQKPEEPATEAIWLEQDRLQSALMQLAEEKLSQTPQEIRWRRAHRRRFSRIDELDIVTAKGIEPWVCKQVASGVEDLLFGSPTDRLHREFQWLTLGATMATSGPTTVPRPIGLVADGRALVMQRIEAPSLESLWPGVHHDARRRSLERLERHFHRLGTWLRACQTPLFSTGWSDCWLGDLLRHATFRLNQLESVCDRPVLQAVRRSLEHHFERVSAAGELKLALTRCHGDFGPWNVLVDGDHLTVLDFACSRPQLPNYDLLAMLVFLEDEQSTVRHSATRLRRLQKSLLTGYRATVETPSYATAMCEGLHRICRLQDCWQHPSPSWLQRVRDRHASERHLAWLLRDLWTPSYECNA